MTNPAAGENQRRIRRQERPAPLDVPPEQFRRAGHALIDQIADLLATMRKRKVTGGLSIGECRNLIDGSRDMPEQGTDLEELLSKTADLLIQHSLFNGHPRFLGYVTSSPAPVGMLADLLAAAVNPNVGAWTLSPIATEIESQTIRWIAELLNYPKSCGGLLVSGGAVANYVGVYTALRSVFLRGSEANTPEHLARATLYASSETHAWVDRAVEMFGFPPDALRSISVDSSQRLCLDELRSRLAADRKAGRTPVAVVGSAGTVSTGAIDPLPAMAELCREQKVWLHVDGAYGGFAAIVESVPDDIRGLSLADSVAIDPHKWLYAPLEAGCALVRDRELLHSAYSFKPPYYRFGEEATNFFDYGPQNSRGFRALKVWLALNQVGRQGYVQMIGDDIALARELYDRLADHAEFEVHTHNLSITTFRFVPTDCRARSGDPDTEAYLNELNRALQERLEASGELFVSNAVLRGRYLLRACIVNFRTSSRDVAEIPAIISRQGNEAHQILQHR